MKKSLSAKICALALAFAIVPADAASSVQACWLQYSAADSDPHIAAAGNLATRIWHKTVSGVLIRHPQGDVLVDAGWHQDALAQMRELSDQQRELGESFLKGKPTSLPVSEALARLGERVTSIRALLPTHAHYDHIGGAVSLHKPVILSDAEVDWLTEQERVPGITPRSLIQALRPWLQRLHFESGPFLDFERSADLYHDGQIVVVPLPGHTPGSVGVFVKAGGTSFLLIGDAADLAEAAERGLPKGVKTRAMTDNDPEGADRQVQLLAKFHKNHPNIVMIPAHDSDSYKKVFGIPFTCVGSIP